jgi:hypothetical protein
MIELAAEEAASFELSGVLARKWVEDSNILFQECVIVPVRRMVSRLDIDLIVVVQKVFKGCHCRGMYTRRDAS